MKSPSFSARPYVSRASSSFPCHSRTSPIAISARRKAFRRALIAMGDVRLWQGKLDEARETYGRAEKLGDFIPAQVRAARLGAYPDSVQEYLDSGNTGAALDLVDKWDEKFPTDKPSGHS